MTHAEAVEMLGLSPDPDASAVRRRFGELHGEFQVRLTNAPTAALQRLYREKLGALQEAQALLLGASAPGSYVDLPAIAPIHPAGAPMPNAPARDPRGNSVRPVLNVVPAPGPTDRARAVPAMVILIAAAVVAVWYVISSSASVRRERAAADERAHDSTLAAAVQRGRDAALAELAQQRPQESLVPAPGHRQQAEAARRASNRNALTPDTWPRPLSQPSPAYPEVMRAAGIEGKVVFSFEVDATGRVVPSTVRLVESTHKAFEEPARQVILATPFEPAVSGGVPVRALVQQSIAFRLN